MLWEDDCFKGMRALTGRMEMPQTIDILNDVGRPEGVSHVCRLSRDQQLHGALVLEAAALVSAESLANLRSEEPGLVREVQRRPKTRWSAAERSERSAKANAMMILDGSDT